MAAVDIRNHVMGLVRMLASKEEQLSYERVVPIADVPSELICMWFDDLYHPEASFFLEAFSPIERDRLAEFHSFYGARIKRIPNKLAEMHENETWFEVMREAQRVLEYLS